MGIAEGMEALITRVGRPMVMHQHAREVGRWFQPRGAGHMQPVPMLESVRKGANDGSQAKTDPLHRNRNQVNQSSLKKFIRL